MEYLPVLIMMAAGIFIGGTILVLTSVFGPRQPNKIKDSAVECGVPVAPMSKGNRVSVRFYLVAILFLLFDIETVFFYPWAVIFKKSLSAGSFIMFEMLAFIGVLLVGYIYVLRKGALDWE